MMRMSDYKNYPIMWVKAKFAHGKRPFFVAYCGKTRHAIKISTDVLTVLIVRDFYVTGNECEEGKRCFNFDCPLNKATDASLREAWGIKRRKGQNLMNIKFGKDMWPEDKKITSGVLTGPKQAPLIEIARENAQEFT